MKSKKPSGRDAVQLKRKIVIGGDKRWGIVHEQE